jgi:hypothetical protein
MMAVQEQKCSTSSMIHFTVFSAKDPVWFSKYQGENNQELVYEAKFIFDDRYCKSVMISMESNCFCGYGRLS